MRHIEYDPATLGEIDEVDVVDLRHVAANRVDEYMRARGELRELRVGDSCAQELAALWRSLPAGEMERCHVPPYGLRFRVGGVVTVAASLCWECNNAFGFVADQAITFSFDGQAPAARVLYEQLFVILPRVILPREPA